MNYKPENKLTESHERLLMRYHDGECSWFAAWRAKYLIDRSANAKSYFHNLQGICEQVTDSTKGALRPVDLWSRIERRMDQEENAALFLGNRSFVKLTPSSSRWAPSRWGMRNGLIFGAPVAACALVFSFLLGPIEKSPEYEVAENTNPVGGSVQVDQSSVAPVAVASVPMYPRSLETVRSAPATQFVRAHDPWEVEWIRSDGRVRMIQQRSGRAPILWIRRQGPAPSLQQNEVHTLKDGSELRIIDNRVPQAISVANE